ncbi:MAG TPA: methylated-DNA--[protein]-cysteine S-methyltransferase [Terriglobia bacterium]|nr:methylated-DNA--[protein]-cysteine S-methyltransferase [Terriglobia bacterium]
MRDRAIRTASSGGGRLLRGGRIPSPFGPMTALVDEHGRLTRLAFPGEVESPRWRVDMNAIIWDDQAITLINRQIDAYFAGKRRDFDLPLAPQGTPFQQKMWAALQRIPFGSSLSYGAFAARLGFPRAARAIGAANGANPISLVIPCHRLIASSGALTGYAGGLDVKRGLLEFESAAAAT